MGYLPPVELIILVTLFSAARFENQRWVRARRQGLQGSNQVIGAFVDTTGFLALMFAVAFLVAYGFDTSLLHALALLGCSLLGGLGVSVLLGLMFGGDNFAIWGIATLLVWFFAIALFPWTSWFGMA
ncbi:MAG: hypothetical protein U5L06_12130 [Rhodovibrio sp.]|nr:hypothetical protein [Rhodovibrio sp.]